jgi:hypothetical protein
VAGKPQEAGTKASSFQRLFLAPRWLRRNCWCTAAASIGSGIGRMGTGGLKLTLSDLQRLAAATAAVKLPMRAG